LPETDLELLTAAAQAAGQIARDYFQRSAQAWEKPDGAGPVTEADLAVNSMLLDMLRGSRPEYGWLSEESEDDGERSATDAVFVVDPIDGTRSFIQGARTWAHALAVVEKGTVTSAVVFLPMLDKLYTAERGLGAFLNGNPITPSKASTLEGADILAARPVMDARHWAVEAPSMKRSHRPSLAYRMALVAEGRFDGMLTLRPTWEWDIAAGTLILEEAGAVATDRHGEPLGFNNKVPQLPGVIAGPAAVHKELSNALVYAR
jgi:myo-inositol-1(or 4)-monophosphatase